VLETLDPDGMLLESIVNKDGFVSACELVILLVNNKNKAVAFKNLNVEMLNQTTQFDKAFQEFAPAVGY
jgi:hypothetical protein